MEVIEIIVIIFMLIIAGLFFCLSVLVITSFGVDLYIDLKEQIKELKDKEK